MVATLYPTFGSTWIHIFKIGLTMIVQKVEFQTLSAIRNKLWSSMIKLRRMLFLELDKRTSL
jgi:hypothetical protein